MNTAATKPKTARSAGVRAGAAKVMVSFGGVVLAQIHGLEAKTPSAGIAPCQLIDVIRQGLPVQELAALLASLDVPMEKLAPLLGISKATLHRRKAQGRLSPGESDRVIRYARLMGKAVETLEGDHAARLWLSSAQVGLGGAVPLDYAGTEVGAREVEDLLGRIEYGVYS